jgi:hypothetical protein
MNGAPSLVRVGCAAGFAGDRFDAGVALSDALAAAGGTAYLIYETLGERTLAIAQLERRRDPEAGCTPGIRDYLRPVLPRCREAGIRIVANFGAANPRAAAREVRALADDLKVTATVAVIEGDDLLESLGAETVRGWPNDEGLDLAGHDIVAANAYLGAGPIVEALARGADVVIVGRCTDTALTLGPLMHEFGWAADDWPRLAGGLLAGHLIECAGQVTGGYFADPGRKDVPALAELGFPIAEVGADGTVAITKPDATGGCVSEATVKEQLLYEIHDPGAYLTPDATLDVTGVTLRQAGPNRVELKGAQGRPPPPTHKVTVSIATGFLAEGEISYAGPNALARAELAAGVLKERLRLGGIDCPVRCDILGTVAVFDDRGAALRRAGGFAPDGDYRVRLAGEAPSRREAEAIAREVLSLYTCGPAAGGGVRTAVSGRIRTVSSHVPRDLVRPRVSILGAER